MSDCKCPEGDFRPCHEEKQRLLLQVGEQERLLIEGRKAYASMERLNGAYKAALEEIVKLDAKCNTECADIAHAALADRPKDEEKPPCKHGWTGGEDCIPCAEKRKCECIPGVHKNCPEHGYPALRPIEGPGSVDE